MNLQKHDGNHTKKQNIMSLLVVEYWPSSYLNLNIFLIPMGCKYHT